MLDVDAGASAAIVAPNDAAVAAKEVVVAKRVVAPKKTAKQGKTSEVKRKRSCKTEEVP